MRADSKNRPAKEVLSHTEPLAGEASHETEPLDDVHAATTVLSRDEIPDVTDLAAEPQVQVGSLLRERFLLKEEVDAGGMGVVYKALDQQLADAYGNSPSVAIKVLSPKLAQNSKALRALQQEATKIRCLTHPHIVRFIDFDRDGDQYFLVMEWLEGRTLASILDSPDARNIDRIYSMRIVRQVGEALEYAHRCGIVHADVKPGNVMILPNGDAKLFDFGVARVRQAQSASRDERDALGAATPAYASMQVLTGDVPAATDDVFSLACLLYRLIAGYRVFGPRNAADASQEGMTPQRPQGFTDKQWSAMRKALSYARVTRFATMDEFIEAVEEEVNPVLDSPSPPTMDLDVASRRRVLPIAAAVLLLVVTVGMAITDQGRSWLQSLVEPGGPRPNAAAPENDPIATVPELVTGTAELDRD
ncbi:MAG: serine/threonine protein kinase, partial [Gammaproteobacteria bacterium]|nr:serine/threonine protein kinase [Gammaproteobacteria bacterium]